MCCLCFAEACTTPAAHPPVVCWWCCAAGNSKASTSAPKAWAMTYGVRSSSHIMLWLLPCTCLLSTCSNNIMFVCALTGIRACLHLHLTVMCRTGHVHTGLCRPCQRQPAAASSNATSSSSNTSRSSKSSQARRCRWQRQQAFQAEAQPAWQQRRRRQRCNASTCFCCWSCFSCPCCCRFPCSYSSSRGCACTCACVETFSWCSWL